MVWSSAAAKPAAGHSPAAKAPPGWAAGALELVVEPAACGLEAATEARGPPGAAANAVRWNSASPYAATVFARPAARVSDGLPAASPSAVVLKADEQPEAPAHAPPAWFPEAEKPADERPPGSAASPQAELAPIAAGSVGRPRRFGPSPAALEA